MEDKLFENINGFNLIPHNSILKLVYSEDKIIELCKKYMLEKVGLELDFNVDIYSEYNDGESTTEFSFTANFEDLDENELELLDKAGIYEEELLETILKKIFNSPHYIDIYAYGDYKDGIMFELEMPLSHLNDLKK